MKFVVFATFFLSLVACNKKPAAALPVYYDVPAFRLIAQDGRPFDSSVALKDKIWVADFIYTTCPGPCPRMTSQMREVQRAIAKMPDVTLVSFTVDPARDTSPVLAEYAKLHGASSEQWFFLTGEPATLQTLDRDVFKLGNVDASLQHSTRFVLVDHRSRIRGYYDTSESRTIPRLIEDIYALVRDRT